MKIAFSTNGNSMASVIEGAFGRCRFFLVFDTDSTEHKIHENSGANMAGGAGIKAAEIIGNLGVDTLVTGSLGPNARPVLESAGVTVVFREGKIEDALASLVESPSNENHEKAEKEAPGARSPSGYCYCRKCARKLEGVIDHPCYKLKCPECGSILERRYQ